MRASGVLAVKPLAETLTCWASRRPEFGVTDTDGAAPAGAAANPMASIAPIVATTTNLNPFISSPLFEARSAPRHTQHPASLVSEHKTHNSAREFQYLLSAQTRHAQM